MRPIASDQQPLGGIFLALGSNLGDRRAHLQAALAGLEERGVRLLRCSRVYRTAPVGGPPQEEFLNMVVEADSDLSPGELLEVGHALERARGRRRDGEVRWGPRTLDIDLLLFRDRVVAEPTLQLPHPRMEGRRFVLKPLAELAADAVHPISGRTIRDLLAACDPGPAVIPAGPLGPVAPSRGIPLR